MDFSAYKGWIIPEGNVAQVVDESGIEIWSGIKWPDDLDTGLEFASASPFTISVNEYSKWDGTMEYCNGGDWSLWDGSEISSGRTKDGQCIYIRGTGNTKAVDPV